jgi:hypothetical protein
MNGAGLLIAAVGLAIAVGAWASVLFFIPNALRSIFRYNLWALRDQVVDDVLDGEVPRDQAMALVKRIEFTIQNAADLSVLNLWAVHRATRNVRVPEPLAVYHPRLKAYARKWHSLSFRYAAFGSPSGWIAFVFLSAAWLPYKVLSQYLATASQRKRHTRPQERLSERLEDELAKVSDPRWTSLKKKVRPRALVQV